ncbi:MAG: hypothetical protein OXD34_05720 [bacterium]|nr:hypothetical protein [bacterium]
MQYQVVEAQSFWDCVDAMRRDDQYKGALMDTLAELRLKPFQNQKLKTHGVGLASNGKKVFASDVGGRASDRRIVWQVFSNTILVLLYGTHKIYDRIKRMRVDFDPADRVFTVFEKAPDSGVDRTYQRHRENVGKLFMAWTDAELRSFGFPTPVVANLRRIDTDKGLLDMGDELGDRYFEMAYNLIAHRHPEGGGAASVIFDLEEDPVPPEVTEEDREVERHLREDTMAPWFTRTEPEFLAAVMGRPIEDWMIFLHPNQRSAIGRHYSGPARVRGSAGTGKTVVGLHRAVWLAKRNRRLREQRKDQLIPADGVIRPVLFTTFIKTLPPVFEALYLRLAGALAGEVEFVNVDRLARKVCTRAGEQLIPDMRAVDAAFKTAFMRTVPPGSPLARSGFTERYVREEISVVIKGRAIDSLDEYLQIARIGRRVPMGRSLRTQVWELRKAWDREMASLGVVDFPDIILRALHHARRLEEPLYSAVIVDEAQDITMAGLLFLRALVNAPNPDEDRPNGLLILGDGAQRIYPGGYTLRQAGIEVRGRTTVLSVNYRNTDEILGAAMAVAGDNRVHDLAEDFRRGDERAATSRRGPRPLLVKASGLDGQLDEIVRRIGQITEADKDIGAGGVAILVPMNHQVKKACDRIKRTRFGVQRLERYNGRPNNLIKVGTFHRGKGLEFKAVFLPDLTKGRFPRKPRRNQTVEEAAEARELEISQLFVAMTRARDILVLLYDDQPSEALVYVVDQFEQQEAIKAQPQFWQADTPGSV